MRDINRGPAGFMHPPYAQQGHSNRHHPNQPLQVPSFGPTFMGPVPPTGFRFYGPHRFNPNLRHRNLPHLRVLPEDVTFFYPPCHFSSRFLDKFCGHELCF